MSIDFDPAAHTYTRFGLAYTSVTTGLSVMTDFSRVPPAILERKRLIGTAVHAAIEYINKGTLIYSSLHPLIKPYVDNYLRWKEEVGYVSVFSEQRVFCDPFRSAGTLDDGGYITRVPTIPASLLWIIDYKCTAKIYASAGPQTAAYDQQARSCGLISRREQTRRAVLRITPNPGKNYVQFSEMRNAGDFSTFTNCLMQYRSEQHAISQRNASGESGRTDGGYDGSIRADAIGKTSGIEYADASDFSELEGGWDAELREAVESILGAHRSANTGQSALV